MNAFSHSLFTVFRKEWTDALRDRRAWVAALSIALLAGPVVLLLISNFISSIEAKAALRQIVIVAPERAPTLVNFLQRQGANIQTAPADFQAQLKQGTLQTAVFVPSINFEQRLASGQTQDLEVYYDASHDKTQPIVRSALALVESFNQELGVRRLIARGISPQLLQAIDLEEKDLAPPRARGAQLLFIVPWTALLMAAYGAFAVAIDVTAGERERGSLEPLLCNPLPISALLSAKWAAATLSAWVIVAITLAGFWVSMPFIKNPTLSALMQLHTRELAIFAVILMPFAGLMAALNMLAATFGRSYKEAQTYVSVLTMAVQFSALIPIFLASRDVAWLRLIPSIGQITVMAKTVRGEPLDLYEWLVPGLVSALGTVLCLILLARLLRKESIIFARS